MAPRRGAAASAAASARVIALGMLTGAGTALAIGWWMRGRGPAAGQPWAAYAACAYAILSPVFAFFVRRLKPVPRAEGTAPEVYVQALHARTVLTYAPLEAGVLLSALALILGPFEWPLLAAAVPLGVMVVLFPRE